MRLFFLATLLCAALAGADGEPGLAAPKGAIIGPDDTVTIAAMNADEISKPWRVGANGELNLPMVGRIQAAGMTAEQLEQVLAARMRKFLLDPQVAVVITEFRSQPVTVTGLVEKPGTYQLQGARTLLDVLVMAGGPKETAGPSITLTRGMEHGGIGYPGAREDETGKFRVLQVPLKEVMDGTSAAANIPVVPHDLVSISEFKQPRMVTISGEVNKPGAVELVTQDTVSLLKMVALAGGLTRTASAGKTIVVHLNEKGVQSSTAFVDLKRILKGDARDLDLTPGDVVIVPSNTIMSYLQAASLSAVTTGVYVLGKF